LPARLSGVDVRQDLILAPVNKVHHVHTVTRVAEMLGGDEDWLCDVATEMDQEDGLIWVYGPGDTSVMAFTAGTSGIGKVSIQSVGRRCLTSNQRSQRLIVVGERI
jgi:hypothetical protein